MFPKLVRLRWRWAGRDWELLEELQPEALPPGSERPDDAEPHQLLGKKRQREDEEPVDERADKR